MKHNYEEINEHIQWLIKFMQEEYPNDFELTINSISADIHSTLKTMSFLDDNVMKEKDHLPWLSSEQFAKCQKDIILENIKKGLNYKTKEGKIR